MRLVVTLALALAGCWMMTSDIIAQEPPKELLGVWQAVSMATGDKDAPPEAVKMMRFTFKKDELLVRGNFQDGREESCKYKVDTSKSPKQLEFNPPKEPKPVLGIYRIEKEKLEVWIRKSGDPKGRPESFEKNKDASIVRVIFERVESASK